ncbi:MAG: hypothetical protein RBS80_11940 [Thermoguttaceae bacterium]|jgi:hypothetical protein|nr:hypothetical protein [Thermoguttaceae bacterium]
MNKAFIREPEQTLDLCPRCGSKGEPVGIEPLKSYLTDQQRQGLAEPVSFCPSPKCRVVYFDCLERVVLASDTTRPVYPKDPTAPICACFGLTQEDIEQDVQEDVVTRIKAVLEKAKSPEARCAKMAANGKPCVAFVQKYYMQCRNHMGESGT